MQYAIVKDNKVINIIVADKTFAEIYAAERKAEAILDDGTNKPAHIDGDIKDGKFRPPAPILDYPSKGKVTWDNENWVWVMPDLLED